MASPKGDGFLLCVWIAALIKARSEADNIAALTATSYYVLCSPKRDNATGRMGFTLHKLRRLVAIALNRALGFD